MSDYLTILKQNIGAVEISFSDLVGKVQSGAVACSGGLGLMMFSEISGNIATQICIFCGESISFLIGGVTLIR